MVPVASPAAAPTPLWITGTEWRSGDRVALRRVLNGRYDVHARVVTRTLAEEPGLRVAGASADLVAELVAVCAYQAGEQDAVNKALRVGGDPDLDHREALLARGAARGLRRFPAVLGPVFAVGQEADAVLAGYRVGDELVEPAFVDVDLAGQRVPGAAVEFVIWSVSARRLDRISSVLAGIAVFPPATRFSVVAVDLPGGNGGPLRVLLRDRAGDRPGRDIRADRLVDRLRSAAPPGTAERPLRRLSFVPGLDEHGRRYTRAPVTASGQVHQVSRGGARP